jgi:ABC-2 type transport system permease protein
VTGLAFAGLAAAVGQLTESSRTAVALAAGAGLGVAFLVRGAGDMVAAEGSTLSWFSPLAWPQQTAPFVLDRWWPLLLSIGFAAATTTLAYVLSTRRDLGAGLVPPRTGRAHATGWLGSSLALAWRLQRASILWWTAAMAVAGLSFGAFADSATPSDMPEILVDAFGGAEVMLAGYLAYMAVFLAIIIGVFAILAVQGLRSEETGGRLAPVLSTPVSRRAWLGGNVAVSAAGVVLMLAAGGVGTGAGAAATTGDTAPVWDATLAHLNQAPAVLVVLGLAAMLFGVAPRLIGLSWIVLVYGFITAVFGQLMGLPDWAFDLSPFGHAAVMPLEDFAPVPAAGLAILAAALVAIGLIGFGRRDVDVS